LYKFATIPTSSLHSSLSSNNSLRNLSSTNHYVAQCNSDFLHNSATLPIVNSTTIAINDEFVNDDFISTFVSDVSSNINSSSCSSYKLWHSRLGHPHFEILKHVLRLCNVPLPSKSALDLCTACCLGKCHRLPAPSSNTMYTHPFELVVCDLWGPAPMTSSVGYTYFLTCVDAFSRFTCVFPLKLKSDTMPQFVCFKTMVELQFNCKIKAVQTDGGGEFRPFSKYFADIGIIHHLACPHTHHQNGIVERKHRHVVETGLTLLAQANIPLKYWDHAFVTASYLINRLPTLILGHKSPHFVLLGKEPDYRSLRTFGCACFPFLRPYNVNKLDYRSQECIFLGYSMSHKGYKCLSSSGRVYISKDVLFNELHFPYNEIMSTSSNSVNNFVNSNNTAHNSSNWFTSSFTLPTPIQHISPAPSPQVSSPAHSSQSPSPTQTDSPTSPHSIAQNDSPTSPHSLASTSTIQPSNSPSPISTCNTQPTSNSYSPGHLPPLIQNAHPMKTRAKHGIVQPKRYPTL